MIAPIDSSTVRLFSPTEFLPDVLKTMEPETLSQNIKFAQLILQVHQDVARNGNVEAEHYYFFIPEVARDMAKARYTLEIMFAEIKRRNNSQTQEVQMN